MEVCVEIVILTTMNLNLKTWKVKWAVAILDVKKIIEQKRGR